MGMMDWSVIDAVVEQARARGATALLETEGNTLLEALGFRLPGRLFVRNSQEVARSGDPSMGSGFSRIASDRVVVKVISPGILHKSDVGGVKIVANDRQAVAGVIGEMEEKFATQEVAGYTIGEFVAYDHALGHELLLGLRWTEDFGPVVTFGPGGIYTEFLAANFKAGRDVAIFSPEIDDESRIVQALECVAVTSLVTGRLRGQAAQIQTREFATAVSRFMALARRYMPGTIAECEINPLVIAQGGLVALDILVKLAPVPPPVGQGFSLASVLANPRPVHKLKRLLEPKSAAIIGVSERLNPGHIILNNLIREGFDRSRIAVIKPDTETIEGCRCYPDVASLPEPVDLFVVAVSASQAAEVVTDVIEHRKAESLIVIPGGLEEKRGTERLTSRMRQALAGARASAWQGPLINGGNCLGIRSLPGRYDTMFIPEHKLPVPGGPMSPIAFISQSGAFAISRMSKLPMNPKYAITLGNQMDLTIGDYLEYLKGDPDIRLFAVYVEGFRPLDGQRFLKAASDITASGRTVLLYRAGRTDAGAQASASHTASIAGDYAVTRELARAAGVVVAGSLQDYEDLIKLFAWLGDRPVTGLRLGAVSNAGFECVAVADNLGAFTLPAFDVVTTVRLDAVLRASRVDTVVDVHNPLDLTPMADDAAYEHVIRAVVDAPDVDVVVVGCVPLTPAMNTLPAGDGHKEDLTRAESFSSRMARLKQTTTKPWIAVVDAGHVYDPLVAALERSEIPTFREADQALRLFNVFCAARRARAVALQ
jgi:acyl-CoA synthetase (NDP forming)